MPSVLRTAALVAAALTLAGCASGTAGADVDSQSPSETTTTAPEPSGTPAPAPAPTDDAGADGTRPSGTPLLQGLAVHLTITIDMTGEGDIFTGWLTCDPPGGSHPDPLLACAAIEAAGGAAAFEPVPAGVMCTEIYGGPQTAHAEGTVGDVTIDADFSRTNGCEIARWDALAEILGDATGV